MMGYVKLPEPACDHLGSVCLDAFGDMVFRWCGNCGRTFLLTGITDGLAWEEVSEPGEVRDVVGVAEAVQPMPRGKGKRTVQSQSKPKRRPRPPVQDVPRPLQLDAPAEEGAEEI